MDLLPDHIGGSFVVSLPIRRCVLGCQPSRCDWNHRARGGAVWLRIFAGSIRPVRPRSL